MKKVVWVLLALSVLTLKSCLNHNEEEQYGGCTVPETSKFSMHVQPLTLANCMPCHNSDNQTSGITLDTYTGAREAAMSGRLSCAINHGDDCANMPQNGPQLSDCRITTIDNWIDDGAQNN